MRTLEEINQEIIDRVQSDTTLGPVLTSTSRTAIWRLWAYVVACSIYTLEVLFDAHRTEIESALLLQHAHTLRWYTEKAKSFMLGYELPPFQDRYDTAELTDEQITAAQIVSYAATVRASRDNGNVYLRCKVAKGNLDLEPLTVTELTAFTSYMNQIQDAGVELDITSADGDHIQQKWLVYYDTQVLDPSGNRLDGTDSDVVRTAIKSYLKSLTFNGQYIQTFHVDALQAISGVVIPHCEYTYTFYGSRPPESVPPSGRIADAGWFKFYDDSDLIIDMQPYIVP